MFCLNEKENTKFLEYCKKNKLYSIQSKIYSENLLYQIKKDLENGLIIQIEINPKTEKELSTVIQYLNSKGYSIVTLKTLIEE